MSIDLNLAETRYFREGDGYVSVGVEPFADNPLTFYDPLGTFLTWGSRFISPSENPYGSPRDFMIQAVGEVRELDCETMQDALYALNVAGYAAAGIYRFEHGGVSYELGGSNPFGDRWDSCPVGFAFVPPEKLAAEGIDRETAITRMGGRCGNTAAGRTARPTSPPSTMPRARRPAAASTTGSTGSRASIRASSPSILVPARR